MALFSKREPRAQDGMARVSASDVVRLLVADDDPHDQMLFAMAAEDCATPAIVTFVGDGVEMIEQLRRQADVDRLPDLAILDLRMPRMDGHQVLEAIADDDRMVSLSTVVFSTSRRNKDVGRSIELGAMGHEVKPSSYEDLVAFIERVVAECLDRRAAIV